MKKLSLYPFASIAKARGGQCISNYYVNSTICLRWRCAMGHIWNAAPASIRKGSWCPDCAGVRRLTLKQLQHVAEARGGACLSDSYHNCVTKLEWRCSAGHEWRATPNQIKKGHWCPYCVRVARLTIHELHQIAVQKGGRCLASEYLRSSMPLRWVCGTGHEWLARASAIRAGHWCPVCSRNQRLKLETLQNVARERGGACLSKNYVNGRAHLLWECSLGHRWRASAAKVKSGGRRKGTWCPECCNLRRRFHGKGRIEEMRKMALARGGACESLAYSDSRTKLIWRCAERHRWEASPTSVVQGSWCPFCARNRKLGLSVMRDIAARRGGTCLAPTYLNGRTAIWWRCGDGHIWKASPGKVKRGSWCPICARIRRRNAQKQFFLRRKTQSFGQAIFQRF
jgi:hypothetical protein